MLDFLTPQIIIAWIISVAFVGIGINLASNYFQRGLDNITSKFSKRLKIRNEKLEAERMVLARSLAKDPQKQNRIAFREIRLQFQSTNSYIQFCVGLFGAITFNLLGYSHWTIWLIYGYMFWSLFLAITYWKSANSISRTLHMIEDVEWAALNTEIKPEANYNDNPKE